MGRVILIVVGVWVISILVLALLGRTSRVTRQEVVDSAGTNRLALIDERMTSIRDLLAGEQSYDFDSLVWRTKAGWVWRDRVAISRTAFQGTSPRTRWVSEIHSL